MSRRALLARSLCDVRGMARPRRIACGHRRVRSDEPDAHWARRGPTHERDRCHAGILHAARVTPILGRGFSTDDVGRPVAIVSHSFWRDALAADPGVIGREIVLGGQTHAIVGVLPERFVFALDRGDIWRPLQVTSTQAVRAGVRVRAVARLAATVSPTSLATALEEVSRAASPPARVIATKVSHGDRRPGDDHARPSCWRRSARRADRLYESGRAPDRAFDRSRPRARGENRARCAPRPRSRDSLLLEAAAIVAAGTIGGVLLALWLTPVVGVSVPRHRQPRDRGELASHRCDVAAGIDLRLDVGIGASLHRDATKCHRRVAPERHSSAARAPAAPRVRDRRGGAAFVLIVSVTLVGRSLLSVLAVNPGFVADGVLTMNVAPPATGYPDRERLVSFYSALHSDLEQRLGERTVGIVDELPLTGDRGRRTTHGRAARTIPGAKPSFASRAPATSRSCGYRWSPADVRRARQCLGSTARRGEPGRWRTAVRARIANRPSDPVRRARPARRDHWPRQRRQHRALDEAFLPTVYCPHGRPPRVRALLSSAAHERTRT